MMIQSASTQSYGYGESPSFAPHAMQNLSTAEKQSSEKASFDTNLLPKLDEKAYQAFENATSLFSEDEKKLAAKTLERAASMSAANQYAVTHDVTLTSDLAVVYNFFENYHDIVSAPQIKHLLNTRLMDEAPVEKGNFNSEHFFDSFIAQLGGSRKLDIRV